MSGKDINELLRRAAERVAKMTKEEYDDMIERQRKSWVKGEMALGMDDRCKRCGQFKDIENSDVCEKCRIERHHV